MLLKVNVVIGEACLRMLCFVLFQVDAHECR